MTLEEILLDSFQIYCGDRSYVPRKLRMESVFYWDEVKDCQASPAIPAIFPQRWPIEVLCPDI